MTIALKANAAGTQGEILLNGNPVAEFLANAVNFPGLAQSLTQNGYVKLPGGLIIQWGSDSQTSDVNGNVVTNMANPFPVAMLCAVVCNGDASVLGDKVFAVTNLNKDYLRWHINAPSALSRCNYITVGY